MVVVPLVVVVVVVMVVVVLMVLLVVVGWLPIVGIIVPGALQCKPCFLL